MPTKNNLHPRRIWTQHYYAGMKQTMDYGGYENLLDAFDDSVKKFAKQKSFSNMGASLTYTELDLQVGRFASFLQHELKLKKGDRIAIQLPNLLQFPIALFGALRAGLVVVNTNPLYTPKEMQYQFKDSGAKAILILANFANHLEQVIKDTDIESVIVTEIGDCLSFPKRLLVNAVVKHLKKMVPTFTLPQAYSFNQALELGAARPYNEVTMNREDTAFLQYTGGTTGVSKGATLSHGNILANMMQIVVWMKPKLKEGEEIILTPLPLYHIFSLSVNCMALMHYGAENVLITNPKDIPAFIKEMKKHKFTVLSGVNTLFNALMNHQDFTTIDFSSCKLSVAGGMALQSNVAKRWLELTKTPIMEGYGLSETSPVLTVNPIWGGDIVGTIGIPVHATDLILLDDDGKEVPIGTEGEIAAKGPQVMKGYWNRPDETAKIFIDGWLKTGDIAIQLESGFFKIVDRKKDMILVSGFNVYPNEVEDAIASHPGVLEVAVIGVADERSGEVVKAFVVKKDASLTEAQVIEYAKKSLTGYKVPRSVEFRTELPKTNVGKILRRALRST
jgi:long-chain acyl-CoA synthetase